MCIICEEHDRGSSSSGAGALLVSLAVVVVAVATYKVMVVLWPVLLVVWLAGCAWELAPRPTRAVARGVVHGVRWLARRRRAAAPAATLTPYAATLSIAGPRVLHAGEVPGVWGSPGEVEAAVRSLAAARYGIPAELLTATATPLPAIETRLSTESEAEPWRT